MPRTWSLDEVDATIRTYVEMLKHELKGDSYVKARHRRALIPRLDDRSEGAVEYKFQNLSAVLAELGYPYIEGYKPQRNYQELLRERVIELLTTSDELQCLLDEVATEDPVTGDAPTSGMETGDAAITSSGAEWNDLPSFDQVLEGPPEQRMTPHNSLPHNSPPRSGRKINHAEREQSNRSLGQAGERYVLALERARLSKAGRTGLADKVEWVAKTQGDGLGFDIRSFETNGEARYIEVKTTRHGKSMPFYVSANEVRVSTDEGARFYLYRVFNFSQAGTSGSGPSGSLFILRGPVSEHCTLTPRSYRADPGME